MKYIGVGKIKNTEYQNNGIINLKDNFIEINE